MDLRRAVTGRHHRIGGRLSLFAEDPGALDRAAAPDASPGAGPFAATARRHFANISPLSSESTPRARSYASL